MAADNAISIGQMRRWKHLRQYLGGYDPPIRAYVLLVCQAMNAWALASCADRVA